ncbi:9378_t:CDS:2 [Entrophospora sp. SA101]|nr:9378_t:CDS:2 [Entrophospora sp. SA101]
MELDHIIERYVPDHLNYDDPIVSLNVDTSNPHPWLRNNFSNEEWKKISDKSSSKINDVGNANFIGENHINDLRNHFYFIHKNSTYTKKDKFISEGTWRSHFTTIPFNIVTRDQLLAGNANQKKYYVYHNPRISIGSKRRKLESISDNDSEEKYHDPKLVKFEIYFSEICLSPWIKLLPEINSDKNKMMRMTKDSYDLITKYSYKKYGKNSNNNKNLDLKNLEVFGAIIYGFNMEVYSLDKVGYRIYRVRLVRTLKIPVREGNNEYYRSLNQLMYAIHYMSSMIENLDKSLKKEKKLLEFSEDLKCCY